MNSRPCWFQDLASLLGNAAALHTLFILIDRSLTDPADRRGILLWWGMLLASYVLLALLPAACGQPGPSRLCPG